MHSGWVVEGYKTSGASSALWDRKTKRVGALRQLSPPCARLAFRDCATTVRHSEYSTENDMFIGCHILDLANLLKRSVGRATCNHDLLAKRHRAKLTVTHGSVSRFTSPSVHFSFDIAHARKYPELATCKTNIHDIA